MGISHKIIIGSSKCKVSLYKNIISGVNTNDGPYNINDVGTHAPIDS